MTSAAFRKPALARKHSIASGIRTGQSKIAEKKLEIPILPHFPSHSSMIETTPRTEKASQVNATLQNPLMKTAGET